MSDILEVVNEELKIYKINSFVFCLLDIKSFDKSENEYINNTEQYRRDGFYLELNIGGKEQRFILHSRQTRDDAYNFIYNFFKNLTLNEIQTINNARLGVYGRQLEV